MNEYGVDALFGRRVRLLYRKLVYDIRTLLIVEFDVVKHINERQEIAGLDPLWLVRPKGRDRADSSLKAQRFYSLRIDRRVVRILAIFVRPSRKRKYLMKDKERSTRRSTNVLSIV